jgi:hypothetical protein
MKRRLLALVACLAFAAPVASAQIQIFPKPGGGGRVTNKVFTTAALTDGSGAVVAKVLTGSATLADSRVIYGMRVSGSGLAPSTSYTLVLDGVVIGSATSTAGGTLKMKFATPSKGRVQAIPQAVLPLAAVHTATLFNTGTQTAVASGTFTTVK